MWFQLKFFLLLSSWIVGMLQISVLVVRDVVRQLGPEAEFENLGWLVRLFRRCCRNHLSTILSLSSFSWLVKTSSRVTRPLRCMESSVVPHREFVIFSHRSSLHQISSWFKINCLWTYSDLPSVNVGDRKMGGPLHQDLLGCNPTQARPNKSPRPFYDPSTSDSQPGQGRKKGSSTSC